MRVAEHRVDRKIAPGFGAEGEVDAATPPHGVRNRTGELVPGFHVVVPFEDGRGGAQGHRGHSTRLDDLHERSAASPAGTEVDRRGEALAPECGDQSGPL